MPVTIKGLDKLIKRIDDYPVAVQKAVDNECKAGALKIRDLAVNLAPVDEGPLRRSIGVKFAPFRSTVFANIFYAPYIEWGTGRKVKVDGGAERKAYASTFQGKRSGGGDFDDFVQSIAAWVGRKGIGAARTSSGRQSKSNASFNSQYESAYWISLYVIRNGIKPQPFFFRALDAIAPEILRNIQKAIKKA